MEDKRKNNDKIININIEDEEFAIKLQFINYFNYKEAFEFLYNLIKLLRENKNYNNNDIIINFDEENENDDKENEENNN